MMKGTKSLTKIATISLLIMLLSKILNVVRDGCMAFSFGTSYILDAYTISAAVPGIIFSMFASGFAEAYVPYYMRVSNENKNVFFINTVCVLTILAILLTVIFVLLSEYFVQVMAPGLDVRTYELTVRFVSIAVLVLPVMVIFNILAAHSQVVEQFIVLNFTNSIIITVISIISVLLATTDSPEIIVYGDIVAEIVAVIVLGRFLVSQNYIDCGISFELVNRDFVNLCKMALPLGACLMINRVNIIVDRWFASNLGEGVISALNYADKVQFMPYSLVVALVLTTCYPRMSSAIAVSDYNTASYYAKKTVNISQFIVVPIACIMFFFPEPIVQILYARGSFSSESVGVTSACLSGYALGLLFYTLREIMSRILAAKLLQMVILRNTFIAVLVNIILNYCFVGVFGYQGIAFSTSVTGIIAFLIMLFDFKKGKIKIFDGFVFKEAIKILICSFGALTYYFASYFFLAAQMNTILIVVHFMSVAVVYFILSYFAKVEVLVWGIKKMSHKYR